MQKRSNVYLTSECSLTTCISQFSIKQLSQSHNLITSLVLVTNQNLTWPPWGLNGVRLITHAVCNRFKINLFDGESAGDEQRVCKLVTL